MKRWVDYIGGATQKENLWIGGTHFGDWLGLDAPSGSYKGSTREDFIASAFYAHSMDLLIRAGRVLGEDVSGYEEKYPKLVEAFQSEFPEYRTQTECILAAWFGLAKDPQGAADQLAQRILDGGMRMETGFVGTPYLLHVLSRFGHADIAWSLLLREDYPSWLYPVKQGATTVWEHWDGIMEDGSFWSEDMNSFNHYAYGAVADWLYEVAAGIRTVEEAPGFERIEISPMPDRRLEWMEASIETRRGLVSCGWQWIGEDLRYTVTVPSEAVIRIDDRTYVKEAGTYTFWGK